VAAANGLLRKSSIVPNFLTLQVHSKTEAVAKALREHLI
jgi:hypothetical protein